MEGEGPSDHPAPPKEGYDGLETVEERLKSTIFVLREERANLQWKYKDALGKNQKYRQKDDESEQKKAELKAEVARLENRNTKILQELKDAVLEITRLKDRNAEVEAEFSNVDAFKSRVSELENFCEAQSQQIIASEVHFDEYVQAVEDLSTHFRERPRHVPRREDFLSPRMIKSEYGGQFDMGILKAARTKSVNSMLSTQPQSVRPISGQFRSIDAKTSPSTLSQATKSKTSAHRNTLNAKFAGAGMDPMPEAERSVQSTSEQRHGEPRLLSPSNGHLVRPRDAGPSECSKKRALLPDVEPSNGSEKRKRQERHHPASQNNATDPRLRRH